MKIRIRHETIYTFSQPVARAVQYLRLTPRRERCQRVLSWRLSGPARLVDWVDGLGNRATIATEHNPSDRLVILVEGEVETIDTNGILPLDDGLPPMMFLRRTPLTAPNDALRALAEPYARLRADQGDIPALHALMNGIADRMPYQSGTTDALSTAAEALEHGVGVCQDHAHVFITCARLMGFPARYVSGYLAAGDGTMASHAWAEAHVPGLGWVSFDPSNRQSATDAYVRLAIGHDYAAARPVVGVTAGGGGEHLDVNIDVQHQE